MLGNLVRKIGDNLFQHTNASLVRAGAKPEWAYTLSLASAAAASIAFVSRWLWVGLILLVFHGTFDYLDGGLRRASGQGNQRPKWWRMDAHALVDKASEVILIAGLIGGKWAGWPLGIAAAMSSIVVTVVGMSAKRWFDIDPGRVLFDRTDRLLVLLLAGMMGAFNIALALVCLMNGIILFQRVVYILLAVRTHNWTT